MEHKVHDELYNDFEQITVWNAKYIKNHKLIAKPYYEYLTGTMTDLHIFLQRKPLWLALAGFFRTMGNHF